MHVLPRFDPNRLPRQSEGFVVAEATPAGHHVGGHPEDAVHPSLGQVQHPQGHPLRQHPRQDEAHGGAGGGRADHRRGAGGHPVLLRRDVIAAQQEDQEAAERGALLRAEAQEEEGPFLHVHRLGRLQVVVGFLQEALHRLFVFQSGLVSWLWGFL